MLLTPIPHVTNCHTFSDPSLLERDVLYGRPPGLLWHSIMFIINRLYFMSNFSLKWDTLPGRPPPWGNDAFPLVSEFPLFPKYFSNSVENFPDFTFSENKFRFSSTKISDDLLLVIDHKFEFRSFSPFPLFRINLSVPPTFPIPPNSPAWFRIAKC